MNAGTLNRLQDYVAELVREGEALDSTKWTRQQPMIRVQVFVDNQAFSKWHARLCHLVHLLGDHAGPWRETISAKAGNDYSIYQRLLGTVRAIQETLAAGLLVRVHELV